MDWLIQQAQQASPFIATFCLLALAIAGKVIKWQNEQREFERAEHRKAEVSWTETAKDIAVTNEQLAQAVDQLTTTLNGVLPALMHIATTRGQQ